MNDPSPLRVGQILKGSLFSELMRVETRRPAGRDAGPAGPADLKKRSQLAAAIVRDPISRLLHRPRNGR